LKHCKRHTSKQEEQSNNRGLMEQTALHMYISKDEAVEGNPARAGHEHHKGKRVPLPLLLPFLLPSYFVWNYRGSDYHMCIQQDRYRNIPLRCQPLLPN
jgi:hypothetical protein